MTFGGVLDSYSVSLATRVVYQPSDSEGPKHARLVLNQLSESEESDVEEKTEKKTAPSGGRLYIPPKIAPMHYGS